MGPLGRPKDSPSVSTSLSQQLLSELDSLLTESVLLSRFMHPSSLKQHPEIPGFLTYSLPKVSKTTSAMASQKMLTLTLTTSYLLLKTSPEDVIVLTFLIRTTKQSSSYLLTISP